MEIRMSPDTLFLILNLVLHPAWALLVFAPRWRLTQRLVQSVVLPVALGLFYLVMVLTVDWPEGAGGHNLQAAMKIFATPWGTLAAWVHYMAFDLFVGAWEVRDAIRRKVPHLAVVPCLVLTLMYGPAGFLLYLVIRAALRRTVTLEEESHAVVPSAAPLKEPVAG
jgi:hypothetical protein